MARPQPQNHKTRYALMFCLAIGLFFIIAPVFVEATAWNKALFNQSNSLCRNVLGTNNYNKAYDGDYGTGGGWWQANSVAGTDEWCLIRLSNQSAFNLQRLDILWYNTEYNTDTGEIYGSNDDNPTGTSGSWSPLVGWGGNSGNNSISFSNNTVGYKWYLVNMTGVTAPAAPAILEFYLDGDLSIGGPPPVGNSSPNITFVSRSPSDITSISLFKDDTSQANFTYAYNLTGLSVPYLSHYLNSTILSCVYVQNGSCLLQNGTVQTITGDNSTVNNTFYVTENSVYPRIQNTNTSITATNVFNLSSSNQYLADAYNNLTLSQSYLFYALQVNSTGIVGVYYYNQSYDLSSNPSLNDNVELLCELDGSTANHTHGSSNYDQLCTFIINGSGYIGSVKATQSGGFLIRGNAQGVRLYGYEGAARNNVSLYSANSGLSWTAQDITLRTHLHQFSGADTFCWAGNGNYTTGSNPQTNGTLCDTLNVSTFPPTPPQILSFNQNNLSALINITFARSLPETINYSVGEYAFSVSNSSGIVKNITILNATPFNNMTYYAFRGTFDSPTAKTQTILDGARIRAIEDLQIYGVIQSKIYGNDTKCYARTERDGVTIASGTYNSSGICMFNQTINLSSGEYVWLLGNNSVTRTLYNTTAINTNHLGFIVDGACEGATTCATNLGTVRNILGIVSQNRDTYNYIYDYAADLYKNTIYTLTITARDDHDQTRSSTSEEFSIFGDAYLNLSLKNAYTNATISGFSGWYYDFNTSSNYTYNSSGSNLSRIQLLKDNSYAIYLEQPNYSISSANLINYTTNNSTNYYTYYLYTNNSVYSTIYSQMTGALVTANVTVNIYSDGYSSTHYTTNGTLFVDNLLDNTYVFSFTAADYSTAYYYVTVADRSTQNLSAYLGPNGTSVIMRVIKRESLNPIYAAVITQYRSVNGSSVVIASRATDISGRTVFDYLPLQRYTFVVQAAGYLTSTFTLDPILFSSYDIPLTLNGSADTSSLSYSDVNVIYTPRYFSSTQQNNFSIYFTAPTGDLSVYNVSLDAPGYSYTGSGSNAGGGTLSTAFNITGAGKTDTVNITYCYKKVSFRPICSTYYLEISGVFSNNTLQSLREGQRYGMAIGDTTLISTILIIIIAGVAVAVAGPAAAGVVSIGLLYVFLFMGFLPVYGVIIGTIVGFLLIAAGGGR